MFGVFTLAIRFDCLFLGNFSKFSLICDFNFWQLAPRIYVSNNALNHFLVNSSAKKNSLKRAKNVVFSLFCILIDRSMGGVGAIAPTSPMATILLVLRHIMVNPALLIHYVQKKARCGPEIATFRTKTPRFLRVIRLNWLAKIDFRGNRSPGFSILLLVILL